MIKTQKKDQAFHVTDLPVKDNSLLIGTKSILEFCDIHLPHLPDHKIISSNMNDPALEKMSVKAA